MGWFDDQAVAGYTPAYAGAYEQGGITGGQSGPVYAGTPTPGAAPEGQPTAPVAPTTTSFDPRQQVGHDGTIGGMTREQYRDAWQGSGVTNNAGMDAWLAQHGGSRQNNSGVVVTPFGETLDMGKAFQTGNGSAAWGGMDGGGAPAGGPVTLGGGGGMPPIFGGPGGFPGAPGGAPAGGSTYTPQKFEPFKYEAFDPKSFNYQDDPGYAFRQKEGVDALQNSAASKGTLLSGNTLKAITNYGQESASQEYQNAFGRAFGTNQANNAGRLGAFNANTGADLGYGNLALGNKSADNQYALGMANVGLGYGNLGLGYHSADQSYDLGLRNNALGYTQAGNSLALGMGNLGLGWANYGLNADGQNFDQGYRLAGMGQSGAAANGAYGGQYAQNAGNNAIGSGNAQAAGQINSGNAWSGAMAGASNNALGAYYGYQYGRPRSGGGATGGEGLL